MINEYLMPGVPLDIAEFDAHGVFDREENPAFHRIYQSPA
jgi:hypothetical protein